MSVLLITHDLGVVAEICRTWRSCTRGAWSRAPRSPSSTASRPTRTPSASSSRGRGPAARAALRPIPGVVPSLADLPPGCAFQDRCFRRHDRCGQDPPWREIAPGHRARCWQPLEGGR